MDSPRFKKYIKSYKDEIYAARHRDIYILATYPNENYKMNFNDWTPKTIDQWKETLNIN
jgi:hypothetical protein